MLCQHVTASVRSLMNFAHHGGDRVLHFLEGEGQHSPEVLNVCVARTVAPYHITFCNICTATSGLRWYGIVRCKLSLEEHDIHNF
jgi:hypothetical protein